ncbi:MAG: hypothetical protein JST54_13490 [Deltaproteobacteria bacterium]|nr:hypothetical protein [Deltaproteobacteria bacterium]
MLAIAVIAVIYAFVMKSKGNRILAAPFHKTGEAKVSNADPKGMISVEGKVHAEQPLLSPCTGTACLAYEVEIFRDYEKESVGSDGKTSTSKGSDKVETMKMGSVFSVDDGSGLVKVDITEGADAEEKKTFEDKVKLGFTVPGELNFGNLRVVTPRLPRDSRTLAFRAVEKIVPVEEKFFVLGKINEGGAIAKPKWRSMMLSAKGRDGLLAHTAKHAKIGFITAAALAVVSAPVIAFVDLKPSDKTVEAPAAALEQKAPAAADDKAADAAPAADEKTAEADAKPELQVPPTNAAIKTNKKNRVASAKGHKGGSPRNAKHY